MSQPETKPLMNIFKRGKRFLLGMQRLSTVSRRLAKLEKKLNSLSKRQAAPPAPLAPELLNRSLVEYRSLKRESWLGMATPWVTEGAKSWLGSNILPTDRVLEFGAGRSTIFWATRAARVVSVEASPDWFLWVYMYLFSRPELLKRVRMHFCPADWNPAFDDGIRRYWKENRQALAEQDVNDLERDLITASFPGNNVVLFDGSIRRPVFVYQISTLNLDEVEVVIIDNTETPFHSIAADFLIPRNFVRHDFVAGPNDKVPRHQNGKHITSIFIRQDRVAGSVAIATHHPVELTHEQRVPFMSAEVLSTEEVREMIMETAAHISRVTGKGFEPRFI